MYRFKYLKTKSKIILNYFFFYKKTNTNIHNNGIHNFREKKKIGILFSNHLEQITTVQSDYNIGDIYIGIVEKILKGLNVAFIKLDDYKQNGFMVLKDDSLFTEDLNTGEEIVIQINKEQISKKGPTVTRNICLEDENIRVYPYIRDKINIDKGYEFQDRQYLQVITKLIKPKGIYTNIHKNRHEINIWELIESLKKITDQKLVIEKNKKKNTVSPRLISPKQEIIDNVLKKKWIKDNTIIITESKIQALKIKNQLISRQYKKKKVYIEYCNKSIFINYQQYVERLIQKALKQKANLITGGHIVIEKTEALTSIDVNSGSFNRLKTSRETILWINLAATKEIINQLKLKNISGIIVIDFIGMSNQDDQLSLLEYLDNQLKLCLTNSQIIQISEIGLVEITKQREERNIYDTFAEKCMSCRGIGYYREKKNLNYATINFLETSPIYG